MEAGQIACFLPEMDICRKTVDAYLQMKWSANQQIIAIARHHVVAECAQCTLNAQALRYSQHRDTMQPQ